MSWIPGIPWRHDGCQWRHHSGFMGSHTSSIQHPARLLEGLPRMDVTTRNINGGQRSCVTSPTLPNPEILVSLKNKSRHCRLSGLYWGASNGDDQQTAHPDPICNDPQPETRNCTNLNNGNPQGPPCIDTVHSLHISVRTIYIHIRPIFHRRLQRASLQIILQPTASP